MAALQLPALPDGFSAAARHGSFRYGPLDSLEIDLSPIPIGDYPADFAEYAGHIYQLSEWHLPVLWTADPQNRQKSAPAGMLAQGVAKNLGLPVAAASVCYRTPLLDGRMGTALFFPYLLRGLPMQSAHTLHDDWRDTDGREWGYVNPQGIRMTVLDDGQVYHLNAPQPPEETAVLDAKPRLIPWSDALVSLLAFSNIKAFSPGASGFALVAARACFVLNPISGFNDEYEALPAYELCFRFYDRNSAPQLEQFLSVQSFYVDARTGKVFRQ